MTDKRLGAASEMDSVQTLYDGIPILPEGINYLRKSLLVNLWNLANHLFAPSTGAWLIDCVFQFHIWRTKLEKQVKILENANICIYL